MSYQISSEPNICIFIIEIVWHKEKNRWKVVKQCKPMTKGKYGRKTMKKSTAQSTTFKHPEEKQVEFNVDTNTIGISSA